MSDVTSPDGRAPRGRRYALVAVAVLAVTAIAIGAIALATSSNGPTKSSVATTTASHPSTVPDTTTTAASVSTTTNAGPGIGASVTVSLPVVTCPTTFGAAPQQLPTIPSFVNVSVPNNLANQLYVYTDQADIMRLVAPSGWVCKANYGADGSGGVSVYPAGQTLSASPLAPDSTEAAIVGNQAGGCAGCAVAQACPLFATAAADYQTQFGGHACPTKRSSAELVTRISASAVGFADPPGTSGSANPSGGQNTAHGVMTYHGAPNSSSWLDTCTLPATEKAICTVSLNRFIDWYGAS